MNAAMTAELQGGFAPVPLKQADFTSKMANVKRPQALVLGRAEPHIEACLQVAEIPCIAAVAMPLRRRHRKGRDSD